MRVNHIFIFTDNFKEAKEELLEFGFVEGSSNTHIGQGTKNKKFYFENFYIEILYPYKIEDLKKEPTLSTKLFNRLDKEDSLYSPFGLCLDDIDESENLFNNALIYKPEFLPSSIHLDILNNEDYKSLPWTFRWYPLIKSNKLKEQKVEHSNKIKNLSKTIFKVNEKDFDSTYIEAFKDNQNIDFKVGNRNLLILEFDKRIQKKEKEFYFLPLKIYY